MYVVIDGIGNENVALDRIFIILFFMCIVYLKINKLMMKIIILNCSKFNPFKRYLYVYCINVCYIVYFTSCFGQ